MTGSSASEAGLLHFAAGKTVFTEGDPGDAVYVVLEGKVELRVRGRLVETVGPGGIIGEMALIEHAPRVATATAREDSNLLPISEQRFMTMIQKTPHFALQIMKVMAARLRRMNSKIGAKSAARRKATAKRPTSRTRAGRSRTSSR